MTSLFLICSPLFSIGQFELSYTFQESTSTVEQSVKELSLNGLFNVKLTDSITSPSAKHYTYQVHLENYPLFNALIKVHEYDSRLVISSPILHFKNSDSFLRIEPRAYVKIVETIDPSINIYTSSFQYYIRNDSIHSGLVVYGNESGIDKQIIIDSKGDIVVEFVMSSNANDTTVSALIFKPDPITRAETSYGGAFVDNDDQSNNELFDALTLDSVTLSWNEDSAHWELKSDAAWALDLDTFPKIAPPTFDELSPSSLHFDRSDDEFEFVNVFYHLNVYQDYYASFGHTLMNFPLRFDAHAKNGADQSSFNSGNGNPQLLFGDGGVDDAEDADVIIHEYGHAISFQSAPMTNVGIERQALDEGIGDYLAMSYSRSISDYKYEQIFNWDGHNEFWDGRETVRYRSYPSDLLDNIYGDGLLWATALMDINNCIGQSATDSILFETMYSFFPFMTLSQAAESFMLTEENSTANDYSEVCEVVFCWYGLLESCHDTLLTNLPLNDPYLGNTYDFAFNNEPVYLFSNGNQIEHIELFDAQGKLLYYEEWNRPESSYYKLRYDQLISGSYIIRVITDSEAFSFKLLRFR